MGALIEFDVWVVKKLWASYLKWDHIVLTKFGLSLMLWADFSPFTSYEFSKI